MFTKANAIWECYPRISYRIYILDPGLVEIWNMDLSTDPEYRSDYVGQIIWCTQHTIKRNRLISLLPWSCLLWTCLSIHVWFVCYDHFPFNLLTCFCLFLSILLCEGRQDRIHKIFTWCLAFVGHCRPCIQYFQIWYDHIWQVRTLLLSCYFLSYNNACSLVVTSTYLL